MSQKSKKELGLERQAELQAQKERDGEAAAARAEENPELWAEFLEDFFDTPVDRYLREEKD